ncbi:unnamed protein product, partial [Trichobilharzia regenti]
VDYSSILIAAFVVSSPPALQKNAGYETLTPTSKDSVLDDRSSSYAVDIPPPPLPPMETNPPFVKATAGNESILALERRQAELEARAAELDRREKEQQARMNSIQSTPKV